jgi:type II secretory pathway component PulK
MTSKTRNRRGVAIIPVIALYAVAMTLIAIWTKSAIREKQQVIRWHEHAQTESLARAGVQRACARLRQEGRAYTGEQWQVPGQDIGTPADAVVEIRVAPWDTNDVENDSLAESDQLVRIVAIADYPAGTERKVRVTKEMIFHLTNTRSRDSGE